MAPEDIITFWFSPDSRKYWFQSTPSFDEDIRHRFEVIWRESLEGGHDDWKKTPEGALALVILFDQFPLNMFRDRPESFQTGALSRQVAGEAIEAGFDKQLADEQKAFMYLPYMHSETLAGQDRSIELFEQAGLVKNLRWAHGHRKIVQRFGRFPHRNKILGRKSTAKELEWLASPEGFNP